MSAQTGIYPHQNDEVRSGAHDTIIVFAIWANAKCVSALSSDTRDLVQKIRSIRIDIKHASDPLAKPT